MIVIKTFEIDSTKNFDNDIIKLTEEIKNGFTITQIERLSSIKAFWPYDQPDLKITLVNKVASNESKPYK